MKSPLLSYHVNRRTVLAALATSGVAACGGGSDGAAGSPVVGGAGGTGTGATAGAGAGAGSTPGTGTVATPGAGSVPATDPTAGQGAGGAPITAPSTGEGTGSLPGTSPNAGQGTGTAPSTGTPAEPGTGGTPGNSTPGSGNSTPGSGSGTSGNGSSGSGNSAGQPDSTAPATDDTTATTSGQSFKTFAPTEPASTEAMYTGAAFAHPGLLHTSADFSRMTANLGRSPWSEGFAQLQSAVSGMSGWKVTATSTVSRYSSPSAGTSNFANFARDIGRAYACALYWKVTGTTAYADKAMDYLNTWSRTLTGIAGDNDVALLALNAYQFANVGEIMRSYAGCTPANLAAFQAMMTIFSDAVVGGDGKSGWLYSSRAPLSSYSNWQLASIAAAMAIGVLKDDVAMFNGALEYFRTGEGNGGVKQAVYYLHPGHLGQTQEAGRDQGHATLSAGLMTVICEMAWNQGINLYGFGNNRVLAGSEYIAKGNLAVAGNFPSMPFREYRIKGIDHTSFATGAQGIQRNQWAIVHNHYANRKGVAAPFCKAFVDTRVETASDNDLPGFGTLTYSRDPFTAATTPTGLMHFVNDGEVTLSWWGVPNATAYVVKRSTAPNTGFVDVATINSGSLLSFVDKGLAAGTYYYAVTARVGLGETGPSNRVMAVTATQLAMRLPFSENGGSTAADSSGNGLAGKLVSAGWGAGRNGASAVALTGSGSYVALPNDLGAELGDCTLSLWTFWTGAGNTREYLLSLGNGGDQFLVVCPKWSDGRTRVLISTSGRDGDVELGTGARMASGRWVHVAVTLSSSLMTLYYDGVQQAQVNCPWQPRHFGRTNKNWLGRWGDNYYSGRIADFRIHHNAMSASEVAALYAST
nr:LamG-like jellyroll fold domain-containing protein [uncultured Roseateles sp.]